MTLRRGRKAENAWLTFPFALLALCIATPATARTLRVPSEYPTIAAGLDASAAGDVILIACGTYLERSLLARSGVTLRGEGPDPSCVVIDAQGLGRVMTCSGASPLTRLEGLTFRGGRIAGYGPFFHGAGMLCNQGSEPVIENCVFEDNYCDYGVGGGFACVDASPSVISCVFRGNTVDGDDAGNSGTGGGAACTRSGASFSDCTFIGNEAHDDGAAMFAIDSPLTITNCQFLENSAGRDGGAIRFQGSNVRIESSVFERNTSGRLGGAIMCYTSFAPVIEQCALRDNFAVSGGGLWVGGIGAATIRSLTIEGNLAGAGGGLMVRFGATPTFEACTIVRNNAGSGGALCCFNEGTPRLTNCTLVQNSASTVGAAVASDECSPVFEQCIIAFHSGARVFGCYSSLDRLPELHCCDLFGNEGGDWAGTCVEQWEGVDGNFSMDPLFCDVASDDLHLRPESPCLPGQHPEGMDCQLIGAREACGATAAKSTSWGAVKRLLGR